MPPAVRLTLLDFHPHQFNRQIGSRNAEYRVDVSGKGLPRGSYHRNRGYERAAGEVDTLSTARYGWCRRGTGGERHAIAGRCEVRISGTGSIVAVSNPRHERPGQHRCCRHCCGKPRCGRRRLRGSGHLLASCDDGRAGIHVPYCHNYGGGVIPCQCELNLAHSNVRRRIGIEKQITHGTPIGPVSASRRIIVKALSSRTANYGLRPHGSFDCGAGIRRLTLLGKST